MEIRGKWFLTHEDSGVEPSYLELLPGGKLIDTDLEGKILTGNHDWKIVNNQLIINFNGYSTFTGLPQNGEIVGTAINKIGKTWNFKACKLLSTNTAINDLNSVVGKWLVKTNLESLDEKILVINAEGKVNYNDQGGHQMDTGLHSAKIIDSKLYLTLNDGYVTYTGQIDGNFISGTAKNIKGKTFEFEARRIQDTKPVSQPIARQQKTWASIVGRWHVKSTADDLDDNILEVSSGGNFRYETLDGEPSGTNHTLKVVNSQMILSLNNNYCIYTGDIGIDEITGTAKNVKGYVFQFEAKRIIETSQSTVLPIKKHTPTHAWLNSLLEFKIAGSKIINSKEYKYFALEYYYPLSKFPDVPVKQREYRQFIFDFKNGVGDCYNKAAIMFASAIINSDKNKVPNEQIAVCCIIPASSLLKTANRFERFCTQLSNLLDIKNGFKIISINQDTDAAHLGGRKRGDITNLKFNRADIQQKRILLFDDVMTTGRSFGAIAEKLTAEGATEVTGFYLAKTYDSYSMGTPKWTNEQPLN